MKLSTRKTALRLIMLPTAFITFSCVSIVQATPPWEQINKLIASDGMSQDLFGYSAAVSGNTAVIGSIHDSDNGIDSGSAYVFDVTTGQQLFKLLESDAATGDEFGNSVSINGNLAVIGAPYGDGNVSRSGSAYVFDVTTGKQLFKLIAADCAADDSFGYSVAISGNNVIVGAPADDDNGPGSGSAYVFDAATGQQLRKLIASDATEFDAFGWSAALDGNTAVIGAENGNGIVDFSGSAYVIDVTTGQQLFKLFASDGSQGDTFGWAVAISGKLAVIGAGQSGDYGYPASGSAYLFDVTTGLQLYKLLAPDRHTLDLFGRSVAISGNTVVVGSANDDDNGLDSGSAYMFDAVTGRQFSKLLAGDGMENDNFGTSVAIDGGMAVVGAWGNSSHGFNSGAAYVFEPRTTNYLSIEPFPLQSGQDGTFDIVQTLPNEQTWLLYSLKGLGQTFIPQLNITIDLSKPKIAAGPAGTDSAGDLQFVLPIPSVVRRIDIWFQTAQYNNATNYFRTQIVP